MSNLSEAALREMLSEARNKLEEYKNMHLSLDMSRGKPCKDQLDLSQGLLKTATEEEDCVTESGFDCRNYGLLGGIPEAKQLFAQLLEVDIKNIIIGGTSSLNLMYDELTRMMVFGNCDSDGPWLKQDKIKFLCPVPGYDRHFALCETYGIEMINVPMNPDGPDMDIIEKLVFSDESIKGVWCVPKYSNPDGTVYSDEVVYRFANLKPAAKDFRIFWDNAYIVHSLYGDPADQPNIITACAKAGRPNMAVEFMSTSKISFPGAGISAMASSDDNIKHSLKYLSIQTICYDKINQLRHVKFFKNADGIREHMKRHAEILRPKFRIVLDALEKIKDCSFAEWTNPSGGYFISLKLMPGCATRVYQLAAEAGVKLTPAGAPFPYHKDPEDRYLRIAPTCPPNGELEIASEILVLCIKIASIEKLI